MLSNSKLVRMVPIDEIRLDLEHPYSCSSEELGKTRQIVEAFGIPAPIPVSKDGIIVGSPHWWLAAKASNFAEVQVSVQADLSTAESKALSIGLERLPRGRKLDKKLLRSRFDELKIANIDISLTGYDRAEIDFIYSIDYPQTLDTNEFRGFENEPPVSRPGDIYRLDKHQIGCGSATDLGFIDRLCEGRKADLAIVCSEPNIEIIELKKAKKSNRTYVTEKRGALSTEENYSRLHDLISPVTKALGDSAPMVTIVHWQDLASLTAASNQMGWTIGDLCIVTKSDGPRSEFYRNDCDLVAFLRREQIPNRQLRSNSGPRSNVWTYDPDRADYNSLFAAKPVAMVADILGDLVKRDDLVLDVSLGSGATLRAAEAGGQIVVGVEKDPRLFDEAIRRWQNATGNKAVNLATHRNFDDASLLLSFDGAR